MSIPDYRPHLLVDLEAVRARAEAATGGPWRAWDRGVGWHITVGDESDEFGRPERLLPEGDRTDIALEADAEFIAAARTDVPALVREVERLSEIIVVLYRVRDEMARKLNDEQLAHAKTMDNFEAHCETHP